MMTYANTLFVVAVCAALAAGRTADGDAEVVSHSVFFTLKEPTRQNIDRCIEACTKYSSKHEGTILFACGERQPESSGPVSDRDFHVTMTLIFKSREAQQKYLDSDDRKRLVVESRPIWAKARMFETNLRRLETPGLTRVEARP
jgi:hypothetical protein